MRNMETLWSLYDECMDVVAALHGGNDGDLGHIGAGAMKRDGEREQEKRMWSTSEGRQQQTPPPVSLFSLSVYDTVMLHPLLFVRKRP
jgi:hypothetical protein